MRLLVSTNRYILNAAKEPVQEEDIIKWAKWWEDSDNRQVGRTQIGPYRISTVFLGLDHRFGDKGPPILFETMIFMDNGWNEEWQERCSTWNEAFDMHHKAMNYAFRLCRWDIIVQKRLKHIYQSWRMVYDGLVYELRKIFRRLITKE